MTDCKYKCIALLLYHHHSTNKCIYSLLPNWILHYYCVLMIPFWFHFNVVIQPYSISFLFFSFLYSLQFCLFVISFFAMRLKIVQPWFKPTSPLGYKLSPNLDLLTSLQVENHFHIVFMWKYMCIYDILQYMFISNSIQLSSIQCLYMHSWYISNFLQNFLFK